MRKALVGKEKYGGAFGGYLGSKAPGDLFPWKNQKIKMFILVASIKQKVSYPPMVGVLVNGEDLPYKVFHLWGCWEAPGAEFKSLSGACACTGAQGLERI